MKGRRKLFILAGSLAFIGCLGFVTTINASSINRQLHAWKLLPEPERLTELYFTAHAKLPTTYTVGETQTVDFTVRNLEYRTVDYIYRITQSDASGNNAIELARGKVTLHHNQTTQPSAAVILTDFGAKSRVNVVLETGAANQANQTIFYTITKQGGGQ